MNAELSHHEATRLFLPLLDHELPEPEERRVRAHLDECGDCGEQWRRYERTVQRVREVPRERAPVNLAGAIHARVNQKRRRGLRKIEHAMVTYRVPYEAILVVLLAAMTIALIARLAS